MFNAKTNQLTMLTLYYSDVIHIKTGTRQTFHGKVMGNLYVNFNEKYSASLALNLIVIIRGFEKLLIVVHFHHHTK